MFFPFFHSSHLLSTNIFLLLCFNHTFSPSFHRTCTLLIPLLLSSSFSFHQSYFPPIPTPPSYLPSIHSPPTSILHPFIIHITSLLPLFSYPLSSSYSPLSCHFFSHQIYFSQPLPYLLFPYSSLPLDLLPTLPSLPLFGYTSPIFLPGSPRLRSFVSVFLFISPSDHVSSSDLPPLQKKKKPVRSCSLWL